MKKMINTLIAFLLFTISSFSQSSVPYGSNQGKYVSINNKQLYYEEYGKGTPLLMLHGGAGSISDFSKVLPDLSKQFRVITADTPGHGRSEQLDSLSYQTLADGFSKFIESLKLDSVYIIGWSDGGVVAMLMAADHPEKVKRIIVVGSQFDFSGYTEPVKQLIGSITPTMVEKDWGTWVPDYIAKAPKGNNWKDFITDLIKMWNSKVFVSPEKVNKIKSRTLIVFGDRDAITIDHGIMMHQSIKGSAFAILPNTTHFAFFEQPELLNMLSIKFLTKK